MRFLDALSTAVTSPIVKRAGAMSSVDNRGGWRSLIGEPFAGAWQHNKELRIDSVLGNPTVYSCVSLIANDIGKLRTKLVAQKEIGAIWEETSSRAFSPVLKRPNRFQNHIQFKQWWVTSKLLHGNTYALKQRDNRGIVVAQYLLDSPRVQPLVAPDGSVYYQLGQDFLSGQTETSITVPASEIIHDRMNCMFHPLVGVSPLFAAGQAAGVGLKIQGNTAWFFGNNSNPGGVLIAPKEISDGTARELKAYWEANYGGTNAGKIAVLGDGLKFEPMRMSAVDSQMIEFMKWTDEKICSVYHVPAYKVGVGPAPSYNNIEALDQGYYSTCLQILIEEFELCQDEGLGIGVDVTIDGRTLGVELDLDGLLRMDSKTQLETLKIGVDGALITPNEGRKRIGLKPLTGGDTVYMQQQNYSLAALHERDKDKPFTQPTQTPQAPPTNELDEEDPMEEAKALLQYIEKGLSCAQI